MSFFLPILGLIGRKQKLTKQRPCSQAIIRTLICMLSYHLNARCNGMFGSFMIKQIRTKDVRHDYLVFLARLSPDISKTCTKINPRWSESEAGRRNNEVGIYVDEE